MSSFLTTIEQLANHAREAAQAAATPEALEQVRVAFLGRKGTFTEAVAALKDLPADERKEAGVAANRVKAAIEQALQVQLDAFAQARRDRLATDEAIDITVPGVAPHPGHLHMTTQAIRDIGAIFTRMGFVRVLAPEVDWEYYAFESLRIDADHPARDNWETFFLDAPAHPKYGRLILTPHTTNGDIREMESHPLPIRTMNIGRTYRRQSDASHIPMFHQFEGLWVDAGITLSHLKGVLDVFAKEFFGSERITRIRPHHFRFTEPSFEVDISCAVCDAGRMGGCKLCKEGWLELGGAGMLHPDVLRAGGVDPEVNTALAFGWGVERTAAMRAGIRLPDLRVMYKNSWDFLRQF
jgi:phenylalanyl-tRNA synthetase alpha chain